MPPTGTTSPLRPTGSAFPTLPGVLSSSDNDTDAEAQHLLNRRTRRNRQYTGNTTDSADATTNATSSSSSGGSSTAFGSTSALVAASRASQNVPRTFAFNVMDGAAFSLWQQTVFQQFVYDLAHKSNAVVGYISGVMGAAQVIAAIVGSVAADKKLKRETVMRIGSFFGFFGALLTAYGVYQKSLPCLYVASLGWGGYVGLNNPAVEALFADSVATVHRTTVYTQKWMACVASYLVGYAVTLVLFWRVGDHWKMWEMAIVMYCGLGLHTVAFAILWTIRDRNKLAPVASSTPASASARTLSLTLPRGASTMSIDENIPAETPLQGPSYMRTYCEACMANGVVPDDNANTSIRDGLCTTCWNGTGHNTARGGQHDAAASLAVGSLGARSVVSDGPVIPEDGADLDHREAPAASGQPQPSGTAASAPATSVTATSTVAPPATATPTDEDIIPFPECLKTKQGIPYYICAGDFIASFGAGMTLRYFPLFFIHDYDVNPTTLTIVFAVVTIVTTFTASLVKLAAVKVFRNRVATAIACRLVGSGAMFYMAFAEGVFAKLVPILIVFVVRMAIMNSIFGITRSVIMDHAPPSQRARWSAVESLCGFTWAGSAVVGGLIADAHGYRATFQVTGCIHTVAALVLIPAAMMITDGVFKETAPAAKPNADAATVHVEDEEHHTRQRRLPRKRREASTRAVTTEEHGEEEAPNHDRHDDAPPPGDHTADAPTGVFCAGPDQPGCFVSVPNERPPRPQGAEVRIDDDDDDEPVPPVGSVNRC